MVKKYKYKHLPVELVERIDILQRELHKDLGLNVTFINAARVMAKRMDTDGKVIKVIMPRSKKKNEKLLFDDS